jgi:pyruvate/2-oxoglutarate/acetoin dehydrogenase E1 component
MPADGNQSVAEPGAEVSMRQVTYLEAIAEAQREEMRRDPSVMIMGEDIEVSIFGTTAGFLEEFGAKRVRNTPISEAGFCGAAVGAAMTGLRPIVDLSIASFIWVAMDQIVSQAAKTRYMFGGQATIPVVYRASMFYGGANAAHHSDRPHSTLMTIPGLKIVTPSGPHEVKGLLKAAIRDDDPVIFLEDSKLWFSRGPVPEEEYVLPLGKAEILRSGTDVTLVAIAGSVPLARRALDELEADGISVELIDPRTVAPMDFDTIYESVRRTGRLVVADPASRTCSAASEIVARVTEDVFESLSTAPRQVTAPDVPIPFSPALENLLYPTSDRIAAAVRGALGEEN